MIQCDIILSDITNRGFILLIFLYILHKYQKIFIYLSNNTIDKTIVGINMHLWKYKELKIIRTKFSLINIVYFLNKCIFILRIVRLNHI